MFSFYSLEESRLILTSYNQDGNLFVTNCFNVGGGIYDVFDEGLFDDSLWDTFEGHRCLYTHLSASVVDESPEPFSALVTCLDADPDQANTIPA